MIVFSKRTNSGRTALLSPHPILTNASSSACKNLDRSAFANGAGPPVMPSMPARRSAIMARVAMAPPMEALVNGLPLLPITTAPAFRHRSASNMSAVITTLRGPACSAIQSSAASKLSDTTTLVISGWSGIRKRALLTSITELRRQRNYGDRCKNPKLRRHSIC